jgi:hypothetical protein
MGGAAADSNNAMSNPAAVTARQKPAWFSDKRIKV